MEDKKNLKPEERSNEDVIDNKVIFATEEDEIVLNCEGQPCNFTYNKDLKDK